MVKAKRRSPPALTLEGREAQLIGLAVDLAEKQLLAGTASAQVITHYLKQSSVRSQIELKKLERENVLLEAKARAVDSSIRLEELYSQAIKAMRIYQGNSDDDDFDQDI